MENITANLQWKKILFTSGVAILCLVFFWLGYESKKIIDHKSSVPTIVQDTSSVSPALSDRGELILLDRKDGSYSIYSSVIAEAVYHQVRAKVIYTKAEYLPEKK